MRALERTMEWLRPLVEKTWDYCIVWKFGDDPSSFIEWVGCCCGGSNGDCNNVKEETGAEQRLLILCKDTYIQHSVRTKACERLAEYPFSMSLYSGIHGEVAMSNQPRWFSHESIGTQILIPVVSGLIELFSAKHVPKDQKAIDFIVSQFNIFVENENPRDEFLEEHLKIKPDSLPYYNLIPSLHFLSPVSQHSTSLSLEGLSTGSTPSNERPSLRSGSGRVSPNQSIGKSMDSLGCAKSSVEKEQLKARQRTEREQYQSKNLITERNRRKRIKDGHFALRALVPKISKMDIPAILGDAIEYIEELQKNVKKLQDELHQLAEEDCNNNNAEIKLEVPERKRAYESTKHSPATGHHGGPFKAVKQIEVQVEVNQIGTRDLLLRFICNQKRGGFSRMMEAITSLGLQVVDANITTFNGMVLNILKIEANGKEVEPKKLKDSLLRSLTSRTVDGTPQREAERIFKIRK